MILAREFAWEPELIIAGQPTRGLDANTVEFVHQRLSEQREKGKATVLVSYDLDEILKLSDRIGVIYEGEMAIFSRGEVNRGEMERIMVKGEK
jgi:simple sugar transport system ATP-binding protein